MNDMSSIEPVHDVLKIDRIDWPAFNRRVQYEGFLVAAKTIADGYSCVSPGRNIQRKGSIGAHIYGFRIAGKLREKAAGQQFTQGEIFLRKVVVTTIPMLFGKGVNSHKLERLKLK